MNPIVSHELRVRDIIDDAMRRRQRGESLPDETILAAHPELAKPLAAALGRLRLIAAARTAAEQIDRDGDRHSSPLNIRCPRCTNMVIASADTAWDEILCPTCGNSFRYPQPASPAPVRPRTIAHFELLRPLGRGSFGEVWEARDTRLDRRVAVKLPRWGESSPRETELFLREARAAAKLRHPNIVAVFEIGQQDEQCYIVSELISGQNVAQWLAASPRDARACARLCCTMARALEHAHRSGIVHRDLKPANVLVDAEGAPHLLDFGLAKRDTAATATLAGQLIGTVAYMSPEQASGRAHECTAASDIYSLGVMLFEMLTGELPFRGAPAMITQQVLHDEPPSPRLFRSDVPRDLETISLKCLEKEPAKRYASAAALADDLDRFGRGEPIHARPIGRVERVWRWCGRNRAVASLAAAVMLALLVGTAVASFFAVRAGSALSAATAAGRQADYEREMAVRSAFNAQLARASMIAPYGPREAWELLSDEQRCPERMRDFAWHYVARLAHREGRVLRGHTQGVNAVVYSPDGKTVASAGRDGTIRLWNAADWSEKATLTGHVGPVNAIAFLPEGVLFSAGDDWTVRRWDLRSGTSNVFARETAAIKCLAVSRSGKFAAWASSGLFLWAEGLLPRITLCDAATGANRKHLMGHKDLVTALVFTPDDTQLISGAYKQDHTIRLWDTATGDCLATLAGHSGAVASLAMMPDGRTLVSAGERIRFWDLPTRSQKPGFADNPSLAINTVAIAPNGLTVAFGQWVREVTIVHSATGTHMATLAGHQEGGMFGLAFSRDGSYLVSAGADPEVRVWDLQSDIHAAEELLELSGPIVAVADAGGDGLLVAASREDRLMTWHSATGQVRNSWTAGHGELRAAVCSSDHSKLFTAGRDGMVRVWDSESAKLLHAWRAHETPVRAIALTADDNELITAGQDGEIIVRRAVDGTPRRNLAAGGAAIHSLATSLDGLVAAGTDDGQVLLWHAASGSLLRKFLAHQQEINSLVFYADGSRLASCSADATARIWDVSTGKCVATLRPQQGPILGVCVSPDGQTLATTGYKLVLWDAVTGQERSLVGDPPGFVTSAAFSPDGRRLITGYGNGPVRLRRLAEREHASR